MALPINVEDLLRQRKVESNRKELSLTEGRNTGIPTIQRELAHNGSPAASFETDEDRLSFLVRIPCHEGEEGISPAFFNETENRNDRVNTGNNGINGLDDGVNATINARDDTISDTIDACHDTINDTINELPEILLRIVEVMRNNPEITRREMAELLNVSDRTISRAVKALQNQDVIT